MTFFAFSIAAVSDLPRGDLLRCPSRRSARARAQSESNGWRSTRAFKCRLLALWSAALALAFAPSGCAWGAEGLVIEQARLGNVFLADEVVQIPVRSAGDRIDWRVEDFFGTQIANGTVPLVAGQAVIEPKLERKGYFEVQLEARENNATLAAAETAFAVIAAPGDTPPEDSPFGVMTHFAQGWDRDLFPLIANAGIKHIRDEQHWSTVEPEPGRFVFPPYYTAYMAEARSHGIEPLIAMAFANEHYDDGLTPYTDAGREGYARYGQAILDQYGDQVRVLEIWNEYNGSFAEGPAAEDRPVHYAKMLEQAYRQIKATRPDVHVLGGAAVLIPLPYLREVFLLGGLEHMDGVVVHPYGAGPEGVERELAALKELIERYSGGVRKRIWVTEFGRHDDSPGGRERSASYLVRMATLLLSEDVERMYWYLMRDYRTPVDNFESMGLVRDQDSPFGRYAPAPAYVAYSNLISQLSGARYVRREPTDPRTHVHLFERGGEEIRVSWSLAPAARVDYETRSPLRVGDIVGDERIVHPADDVVRLVLTENPVFVKGPVAAVRDLRREAILAWSEYDFGQVQGGGGWSYGHYDGDGQGRGDGMEPTGPYTDDDFELLELNENAWGQYWGDQQLGPIQIGESGAHPSTTEDRAVWAVRRWVSNVAGTVQIAGTIGNGSEGDGTRAVILVDGIEVFSADVGGPDGPANLDYTITPVVKEGSLIDFAVTPGPGTNVEFDATGFTALITVPIAAASEQDFATVQGVNGWHYGYYSGHGKGEGDGADPAGPYTDDDFKRLPLFDDEAQNWRDPGLPWLSLSRSAAHPSAVGDRPVWVVRRWVSTIDGAVRITGEITPTSTQGDGTSARILINGTEIFAADAGQEGSSAPIEYVVIASLTKGSLVDFAITPGPGSDIKHDATSFTAIVQLL